MATRGAFLTFKHYWLKHEKNDQFFFRFDREEIRAIFAPKYKPVDNFEVIGRLNFMGYGADTPVQWRLDGEFMSLSIIFSGTMAGEML